MHISVQYRAQKSSHVFTRRPDCWLRVHGANFASDIADLGCVPNKCEILRYTLPSKYLWDFVRGYLEADGSLTMSKGGTLSITFNAKCSHFLHQMNKVISRTANVKATIEYLFLARQHHCDSLEQQKRLAQVIMFVICK